MVFYCLTADTVPHIREYMRLHTEPQSRAFGLFMEWLVPQTAVYGMKLPDHFSLIGDVGLAEYKACLTSKEESSKPTSKSIVRRAYARVGLMGNPSDGFFGKTLSLSIKNFWAEVSICESARLVRQWIMPTVQLMCTDKVLEPHPLNDPTEFGSLADLYGISRQEGYQGGLRLMQVTTQRHAAKALADDRPIGNLQEVLRVLLRAWHCRCTKELSAQVRHQHSSTGFLASQVQLELTPVRLGLLVALPL